MPRAPVRVRIQPSYEQVIFPPKSADVMSYQAYRTAGVGSQFLIPVGELPTLINRYIGVLRCLPLCTAKWCAEKGRSGWSGYGAVQRGVLEWLYVGLCSLWPCYCSRRRCGSRPQACNRLPCRSITCPPDSNSTAYTATCPASPAT